MTESSSPRTEGALGYSPQSLADIVGHQAAIARVRSRFRQGPGDFRAERHDTPLLLYGLPGVGKMTVARMYAKALLCDTPRDDRSIPCNNCPSCTVFDQSASQNFDFYPMDAAIHRDPEDVNKQLRYYPIGPRRVFVIDNFDKATPEFVDALLKPMEAERPSVTPITFVLLARDLRDVRAAGQSRCVVERLDPLSEADVRTLCVGMAAATGIAFADDDALHTLIIGSRGLPELIARVFAASHGSEEINSQQVRQILGIDWGTPILRFWLNLMTNEQPKAQSSPETALPPEKAAIYSRFVLCELLGALRTGMTGRSGEPALRLANEGLLHALLRALRQKAEMARRPPEVLLAELGDVIRQDDFIDEDGFVEFERSLRAKLFYL